MMSEKMPSTQPIPGNGSQSSTRLWQVLTSASAGVVFGFVAEKAKVSSPEVIRGQMEFSKFIMMKMFLSAVVSSTLSLAVLSVMAHHKETRRKFASNSLHSKKRIVIMAGAALLGAGMTLAGSCPGMVLIQIGSGVANSLFTVAGCFSGALFYGAVEPALRRAMSRSKDDKNEQWLDSVTGIRFPILSIGLAVMLSAILLVLEKSIPWTQELPVMPSASVLQSVYWNPILSGAILGMLQIPLGIMLSETIGGSSAYCTLLSRVLPSSTRNSTLEYFREFLPGMNNWWQVVYVVSAVGGAALSATLSSSWGSISGVAPAAGFVGGALMLFGARMASGCTSGHGISGMGMLYVPSCLAVPAMFAGGMATALAMNVFT